MPLAHHSVEIPTQSSIGKLVKREDLVLAFEKISRSIATNRRTPVPRFFLCVAEANLARARFGCKSATPS